MDKFEPGRRRRMRIRQRCSGDGIRCCQPVVELHGAKQPCERSDIHQIIIGVLESAVIAHGKEVFSEN